MIATIHQATGYVTLEFGGIQVTFTRYEWARQLGSIVGRDNHDVAADVCSIIRRAVVDGKVENVWDKAHVCDKYYARSGYQDRPFRRLDWDGS